MVTLCAFIAIVTIPPGKNLNITRCQLAQLEQFHQERAGFHRQKPQYHAAPTGAVGTIPPGKGRLSKTKPQCGANCFDRACQCWGHHLNSSKGRLMILPSSCHPDLIPRQTFVVHIGFSRCLDKQAPKIMKYLYGQF